MDKLRRQLALQSGLAAFLPLLARANVGDAAADPHLPARGARQTLSLDPEVLDFWAHKVRAPYKNYQEHVVAMGSAPVGPLDSTFVFFHPKQGFIPAGLVKPEAIKEFPEKGDVNVVLHVDRFRPSASDLADLESLQTGSLRIDVKQVKPLPGLPEALAWTALATMVANKHGKMPDVDKIQFDPGAAWGQFQTIPLTGGTGFWTWNFFAKKKEGFWASLLDQAGKVLHVAQPFIPLLGIPGIAVSGLIFIDQILGTLQAEGESKWLFKGLDTAVCATRASYDETPGSKLLLTTGSYVVCHETDVSKLNKFEIKDGLLVPLGTKDQDVFDAAAETLKDQTYLTVAVAVKSKKKDA